MADIKLGVLGRPVTVAGKWVTECGGAHLTVAGLTGDFDAGNGGYEPVDDSDFTTRVGYSPSHAGWVRVDVGGGTFDDMTYRIWPTTYDQWTQETLWQFEADDSLGYAWHDLGVFACKGAPVGDWGNGVSVGATTHTVTVSFTPESNPYGGPDMDGPMPLGSVVVVHSEGASINIGASIWVDIEEDPWVLEYTISDVLLDGVSQGIVAALDIDNITSDRSVVAVYVPA